MATQDPSDRRDPTTQGTRRDGRRRTDRYWTVPEIAADLGMSERSIWRKFLEPPDGTRYLPYYNFRGEIRIDAEHYADFKTRCFRERSSA